MRPGRAAIVEGWPIFVTATIVGAAFGLTARQAGLGVLEAIATSVIVFAGAAQFVMVDLLRTGTPVPLIVLTVLLLNARHLLMAAAVRPFVATASPARRLGLAYLLTDETFAMAIGWFRRGHRDLAYYAVFGAVLWSAWNAGTLLGALFGGGLQDPQRLGVDFAITAVFVAIVAVSVRHRADVVVALAAAAVAAVLRIAGASAVAVVVAGALAPLVAFAMREPRPSDDARP
ncbi:MAG TPA: AzlC family ABC transporter permease [Candidatus Limnocylindria bacterium]|nr:AzlC family ABC transporter permease [Candidatus Limnocylindria bacterium]